MRDLQPLGGLRRIGLGVDGAGVQRPLDVDPVAAEDEEVQVELARFPAVPRLATRATLDRLELREQVERRPVWIAGRRGDVEGGGSVAELWLVRDAPRRRRVEARDPPDGYSRQRIEGCRRRPPTIVPHRRGSRRGRRTRERSDGGSSRAPYYPAMTPGPGSSSRRPPRSSASRDRGRCRDPACRARSGCRTAEPRDRGRPVASRRSAPAWLPRRRCDARAASHTDRAAGRPFGRGFASWSPRSAMAGSWSSARARSRSRPRPTAGSCGGRRGVGCRTRWPTTGIRPMSSPSPAPARPSPTYPTCATDNALPRWLDEIAGVPVDDRRGRRRLGIDIDGPLDLVLLGGRWASQLDASDTAATRRAMDGVRAVVDDPNAELLVAGRVSAANLGWLEARTASRTRALIEERGLRTRRPGQRPAASVLGALLERDGPASFAGHVARLGGCRDRRQSGPARAPRRGGRGRLARSGGPLRFGPSARGPDR